MKTCTDCKKSKPETEFSWRNKAAGKRRGKCKECTKAYDAANYQKAPRKKNVRRAVDQRKRDLVNKVWAYKQGKKCADCPQTNPKTFHFDHLPQHKKVANVSALVNRGAAWSAIEAEIAKCEIVCASCHAIRTWDRAGWSRDITIQVPAIEILQLR